MDNQEQTDSHISRQLDRLFGARSNRGDAADPLVGQSLGPYGLVERIGNGSFGIVYQAVDSRSQRIVAIKILKSEILLNREAVSAFEKEATVASRLSHPGIVMLLDNGLSEDQPYLVSEFIDGKDLGGWHALQHQEPQPDDCILRFMLPLLEAVEHAHANGVIHRDIKPGNVLLKRNGESDGDVDSLDYFTPKLADFGLAKLTVDVLVDSRSSLTIGTPMYMAPEQLVPTWGAISARTDIYALGVLMAELMNGRTPRHGMTFSNLLSSVLRKDRDPQILWSDRAGDGIRAIIRRCLQKDPIDRYANVGALKTDILGVLKSPSTKVQGDGFIQRFKQWARHPERPVEICFFVITLNLIMFAWMLFNAYVITWPIYHGQERLSDLTQCLGIAFGNNLLTAVLCALRIYERRWATVIALVVTSSVTVIVPFLAAIGLVQTFNGLYANAPFFRVANHAQVLLLGLVQSALLGISVYSDYASKRRQSERS